MICEIDSRTSINIHRDIILENTVLIHIEIRVNNS